MRRAAVGVATALLAISTLAAGPGAPPAEAQDAERTRALTIYQNDLAAVTLTRRVDLTTGAARLSIDGLSPRIVPGSLDLAAEDVTVRRQRTLPWPITRARLLQAAVGKEVSLIRTPQTAEAPLVRSARLLAVNPDIVVEVAGRIETNPPGRIALRERPKGLPESPTAVFDIASESAGARRLQLRYLSRGLSWTASYVARWNRDGETLDLTGRARIENALPRPVSGDSVTLVAGRVKTVGRKQQPQPQASPRVLEAASAGPGMPQASAQSDLRLYALSGAITLPASSTVSRRLVEANDVAVREQYRLTGLATTRPSADDPNTRHNAALRLVIPDTRKAGVDKALPAGTVRVYDGNLFRGAERIQDTPVGTRMALDLGAAVDVTATVERTAYDKLSRDSYEVGRAITIKNAKDDDVSVRVVGNFRNDWELLSESGNHETDGRGNPIWTLDVPAGGEARLSYRVRVRR